MIRTRRALALPALLMAAAVGLGACSDSGSGTPSASPAFTAGPAKGPYNQADIAYSLGMFPQRVQTLQLTDLALARSKDEKVKAIATQAKDGTSKEVAMFAGYLTGWNTKVPAGTAPADHDAANGLLSQQELTQLQTVPAPQFDKLWLQAMIKHTQGAVKASQAVLGAGQNPDNKHLAESIVTEETQQIKTMQETLTAS